MKNEMFIFVNGRKYIINPEQAFLQLSKFLREVLNLCGLKEVCCEGDCGACTVLVGKSGNNKKVLEYFPIKSCIYLVGQVVNKHIITVEGLADNGVNALQQAFIDHHASQCGYCTPGIVTTMYAFLHGSDQKEVTKEQEVKQALSGNICRCTGYKPIVDAVMSVRPCAVKKIELLYPSETFTDIYTKENCEIIIRYGSRKYYRPTSIEGAIELKKTNKGACILAGGTDINVAVNKNALQINDVLIDVTAIKSLQNVNITEKSIIVGAAVTVEQLKKLAEHEWPALAKFLYHYASPQVRNIATVAGNIANASPISDLLPFMLVMNAQIHLQGTSGKRTVSCRDFLLAYKKTILQENEIIIKIEIPKLKQNEYLQLYKVAKRDTLDIATFSSAFKIQLSSKKLIISASTAFGGIAPTSYFASEVNEYLQDKYFTEEVFCQAGEILAKNITPISDARAEARYRIMLAKNSFKKFYNEFESKGMR